MGLWMQVILLAVGFVMLIKGADFFVEGASGIADKFGIPQLVIGLTIVAFGTSAPEAAVSITAALKGSAEITIGNVLGSNILNVLIILGITALITPLLVQKSTLRVEIPYVIAMSALLAFLGLTDNVVDARDGLILWAGMVLFLGYLLRMTKKGGGQQEELPADGKSESGLKLTLLSAAGLVLVVWGSDVTVDAASAIARTFGWTERLIGLTIVALGTSLPELMTSITAGIKGKADIAVGNIVGSNIFNLLFVVGTTALITPVAYGSHFLVDSLVTIFSALLLWLCVLKDSRLKRWGGVLMLIGYGGYLAYLL